jgi:hypothetical protein
MALGVKKRTTVRRGLLLDRALQKKKNAPARARELSRSNAQEHDLLSFDLGGEFGTVIAHTSAPRSKTLLCSIGTLIDIPNEFWADWGGTGKSKCRVEGFVESLLWPSEQGYHRGPAYVLRALNEAEPEGGFCYPFTPVALRSCMRVGSSYVLGATAEEHPAWKSLDEKEIIEKVDVEQQIQGVFVADGVFATCAESDNSEQGDDPEDDVQRISAVMHVPSSSEAAVCLGNGVSEVARAFPEQHEQAERSHGPHCAFPSAAPTSTAPTRVVDEQVMVHGRLVIVQVEQHIFSVPYLSRASVV